MSSCPNGCSPIFNPSPPRNFGTTDNVGQPIVSFGQSPKRSSGKSSVPHFHQPLVLIGPSRESTAENTSAMMKSKTNSETSAALCLRNRRRTICPWLNPSTSLLAIAPSPDSRNGVSLSLRFLPSFIFHFLLGCEDLALNTAGRRSSSPIRP